MHSIDSQDKESLVSPAYIVGIGASAGGLEAIHELFDNMPGDTNMAFVIVQHLSPDYKSLMPELLTKHTEMRVFEARDRLPLQANCIYVIPSKKLITVENGLLRLWDKTANMSPNTAIDGFFISLANEAGKNAVGIVLSGTGTDGTKGIEAIKNNGGIVVVQDPITAKFDGMPNSAIATGTADLILAPEMIPEELSEFLKETPLLKAFNESNKRDEGVVNEILHVVKKETSHDFSNYKRPTINRRLAKRMIQKNVKSLQDYLQVLQSDSGEIRSLCKEFLIRVTKFFRDTEAFEELKAQVLPVIAAGKSANDTIKVWVVACSTGEEAYTLGILFCEFLESIKRTDLQIKIFASDIDKEALEIASKGVYPETIANDVSAERLEKHFTKEGNKYKISAAIRKLVVFAPHDILKDPPFSKLDLVSCRNMLIYMNATLQKVVLRTLHFALNPSAFLFLGPSENIGILKDFVHEENKKWKIFKNLETPRMMEYEPFVSPLERKVPTPFSGKRLKNALNNVEEIFNETVIEEYKYAGIFIDREFEVKQAIGNFNAFIRFPKDRFNFNLLKMVASDLAIALGSTVRKAIKENERTVARRVKVREDNKVRSINIIVKPYLQQQHYLQPFVFVVLNEEEVTTPPKREPGLDPLALGSERLVELEDELKETRENLQAVIEELETANEELQSRNEEMISANEELQSTNEELQSLNEELHTVNAEHQLKIKELIELNDDLNNYFGNTEIGQLLIDKKLITRRFTPAAKRQINLIPTDIGRSITDISHNFVNLDFVNEIKKVISTGRSLQREVTVTDGKVYQMKITPYVRQDRSHDGVVVTFVEITEIKNLSGIIEGIFDSSLNGITALKAIRDDQNRVVDFVWLASNRSMDHMLGVEAGFLGGKHLMKEFPSLRGDLFDQYVNVVDSGQTLHFEHYMAHSKKWYEIVAVKMHDGVVVTFTDITEKKHASDLLARGFEELKKTSQKLSVTNHQLEQSNYDLMQFASVVSHDLKEPLRKIQIYGSRLQAQKASSGQSDDFDYLNVMINSSNRMQNLIEDLLSFSKLSNKNLFFSETKINEILDRILDDLEILIKEKNAKFHIDQFPIIEAIPGQIHQLFQNLISNALKFNNAEPIIKIRLVQLHPDEHLDPARYISICVEDNGIGFENVFKEKIFGVFQRLHTNNDYQGTGIGLAICKKIVDNHHGRIRAESELNGGSQFTVVLPLRQNKESGNGFHQTNPDRSTSVRESQVKP
jgi:two-component system CheB/CheR fusion protein